MKTFSRLWQYFAEFFLEWEMFQIKDVEKIKTHILCSVTFFSKIVPLMGQCRKIWWSQRPQMAIWRGVACRKSKVTLAQAHANIRAPTPTRTHACTEERTHAPRTHAQDVCNRTSSFTLQKWFRESVIITLYVHCLSFWKMCAPLHAITWNAGTFRVFYTGLL